jgi:hypothetical protein
MGEYHSEVAQYLKNLHLYSVGGETLQQAQGGNIKDLKSQTDAYRIRKY